MTARLFTGIDDPALPAYVQRLTPGKRAAWIKVWNSAFS